MAQILIYKKDNDFPDIIPIDDLDAIVIDSGKGIFDLWVHPRNKKTDNN